MAQPYLGQISIFSFNFPPKGWALCNGASLSIQQNAALFALIGTYYGGNGTTTFMLPNLQGRVPIFYNGTYPIGNQGGEYVHTLLPTETPTHTHLVTANGNPASVSTPVNNLLGSFAAGYGPAVATTTLLPTSVSFMGGSQPHDNMQPYLGINFCIALSGLFPSRN
jgi:microcystin-dependent protein